MDDAWERLRGLRPVAVRVVAVAVMEQENRTGIATVHRSPNDDVGTRPIGIPYAECPPDCALAELCRDGRDPGTPEPVRRAEQRRLFAGRARDGIRAKREIDAHVRRAAKVKLPM